MRHALLSMAFVAALAAAGCEHRYAYAPRPAPEVASIDAVTYGPAIGGPVYDAPDAVPVAAEIVGDAPYTLDSGDKLRVVVFGQDGLSNTYSVDASGRIAMPLIGAVPARGLTTTRLAASISARLRQGYVREPHVAVEVETYRPFFILGEVTFPGQYPYVANMTVETAVAIAGGFTPRAERKEVKLSRPMNGELVRGPAPTNTAVRPGDTITVKERWF